jgi:hypothetical protein
MEREYLATYVTDSEFWACAVEGCQIPFRHEVGITPNHEWKHVRADLYYPTPAVITEQ